MSRRARRRAEAVAAKLIALEPLPPEEDGEEYDAPEEWSPREALDELHEIDQELGLNAQGLSEALGPNWEV